MWRVELGKRAQKDLRLVPEHVRQKLLAWARAVADLGLDEVRKTPGFHDEPLKGKLRGLRSIRLSVAYRAYYRIVAGRVHIVVVERVDKHVY